MMMIVSFFLGIHSVLSACAPNPTHICVTISGGRYWVDRGVEGPVPGGFLELNAGTTFTFEMSGPGFDAHPFSISRSATGPANPIFTDGVSGQFPANKDGAQLRFTPPFSGPSQLYYQSTNDQNMGGPLFIPGACTPSTFNICVTFNGRTYSVDQGSGPVAKGDLVLLAEKTYTFEVVSPAFINYPFALSETNADTGKINPIYTRGVGGNNPASADDQKLTFFPERDGPSTLYYGSTALAGLGGKITVDGACHPTPTHICILHITDQGLPGYYAVDSGTGPVPHGDIAINAGTTYTFQTIGVQLASYPFALTLDQGGQAVTVLVEVDGVVGLNNPCIRTGNELDFTPPPTGPQVYYYQSTSAKGLGGKIIISGACVPSLTNICVTHDGNTPGAYLINRGLPDGALISPEIILEAETTYTFEVVGDIFATYPFVLTSSSLGDAPQESWLGVSDGASGTIPANAEDAKIIFTPSTEGLRNYYYQSTNQFNMGGIITVLGTCSPSEFHICITHDKGTPGKYLVNSGSGPVKQGDIHVSAGINYTIEVVGNTFGIHPLSITSENTGKGEVVWESGITGNYPMVADGDRITFYANPSGPSLLWYQSIRDLNVGGKIIIENACSPSLTTICVSHDGKVPGVYVLEYFTEPEKSTGPIPGLTPVLNAGTTYRFEIRGNFSAYPFTISLGGPGTGRWPPGITRCQAAYKDGDVIEWTPPMVGPSQANYFGYNTADTGGAVTILHTCVPAPTLICIKYVTGTGYMYNRGEGWNTGAVDIVLNTQSVYTFQAVGSGLMAAPMAFTFNDDVVTVPQTKGITGNNPMVSDGDRLVLNPTTLLSELEKAGEYLPFERGLYYQCLGGNCPASAGGKVQLDDNAAVGPDFSLDTQPNNCVAPTPSPTPRDPSSSSTGGDGGGSSGQGPPTTAPPTQEGEGDGGSGKAPAGKSGSTGIIVGVVIAVLALIGAAVGYSMWRKRRVVNHHMIPLNEADATGSYEPPRTQL